MKHVSYLICLIALTACNPIKRITGSKPNGSAYILTIGPSVNKNDIVSIRADIKVTDSGLVDNRAGIGLQVVKLDTSGYKEWGQPDEDGRFSFVVRPGKYYLFFGAVGFGKMKTTEFIVKAGQSVLLEAVLHPIVETICDYEIQTPYKTVPRRLP